MFVHTEQQSFPVHQPSARVFSFKQMEAFSQELGFMKLKQDSEAERNVKWFESVSIGVTI